MHACVASEEFCAYSPDTDDLYLQVLAIHSTSHSDTQVRGKRAAIVANNWLHRVLHMLSLARCSLGVSDEREGVCLRDAELKRFPRVISASNQTSFCSISNNYIASRPEVRTLFWFSKRQWATLLSNIFRSAEYLSRPIFKDVIIMSKDSTFEAWTPT